MNQPRQSKSSEVWTSHRLNQVFSEPPSDQDVRDQVSVNQSSTKKDGRIQVNQSIYWKPSLENVLSNEMVQSVGNLTPLDYFEPSLWCMPISHRRLMNFLRISNVKLQQYSSIYAWKSSRIGFSMPVVSMQKKSSFIHNGIERSFTAIKNFIDIQNHVCFI